MASNDFRKVQIMDNVLQTTDRISYGVVKGGANITPSQYEAINKSPSSITWNIQLPSEATVMDRRVMVEFEGTISYNCTLPAGTPIGTTAINYGYSESLAPFPFNSELCNTLQLTLNNNVVSQNNADIMSVLHRFNDRRELQRYNSSAPIMYDSYLNYSDALGASNNPNGAFNDASNDLSFLGRGAFELIEILGNTPYAGPAAEAKTITIRFKTFEPVMLSPFIWCDPQSNNQGIYGLQTMNLTANLQQPTRIIRSAQRGLFFTLAPPVAPVLIAGAVAPVITLVSVQKAMLHLMLYTRQPSNLVSARNVVPYSQYPRYFTQVQEVIAPDAETTVSSQTIQLNTIPDKIIFGVRKARSSQTCFDADAWLPIEAISINFNNQAGLLSSSQKITLWELSTKSGLNMCWNEWSGNAGVGRNVPTQTYQNVKLCGSLCALSFATQIQLDDVFTQGSIGSFNLQFNVRVKNNTGIPIGPTNPYELILITQESGLFVVERGTSQTYTALLSRSDVLSVSGGPSYSRSSVQRLVGGRESEADLKVLGLGMSGGGLSGGGVSGGGVSGGGLSGGGLSGGGLSGGGQSGGMKKFM